MQDEREYFYYLMCGGVIDLIEGFIPKMIDKGNGRIIIISSIGAKAPMPKSSLYSSIKQVYMHTVNRYQQNLKIIIFQSQ